MSNQRRGQHASGIIDASSAVKSSGPELAPSSVGPLVVPSEEDAGAAIVAKKRKVSAGEASSSNSGAPKSLKSTQSRGQSSVAASSSSQPPANQSVALTATDLRASLSDRLRATTAGVKRRAPEADRSDGLAATDRIGGRALRGDPKFLTSRKQLPIYGFREQIVSAVRNNDAVIVVAETGSGKTTQTAQYLWEAGLLQTQPAGQQHHHHHSSQLQAAGAESSAALTAPLAHPSSSTLHQPVWRGAPSIVVTQPRRVAAITVARRVAAEMGTPMGGANGLVGYSVRFEEVGGPRVRIKFATDGMLLREAMVDPLLSRCVRCMD